MKCVSQGHAKKPDAKTIQKSRAVSRKLRSLKDEAVELRFNHFHSMAMPGGQGAPYGPVPYGRPGAPSSGVAEGTSPHAVPYGDSAQHMAKEAHQLRPLPSGVMTHPSSTQSKPNGPTVNGSWAHLGGGILQWTCIKGLPAPTASAFLESCRCAIKQSKPGLPAPWFKSFSDTYSIWPCRLHVSQHQSSSSTPKRRSTTTSSWILSTSLSGIELILCEGGTTAAWTTSSGATINLWILICQADTHVSA
ncbi:hypothetical protein MRX96_014168 [Rhipicephalus microplus]